LITKQFISLIYFKKNAEKIKTRNSEKLSK
jgi:hypothetical protein